MYVGLILVLSQKLEDACFGDVLHFGGSEAEGNVLSYFKVCNQVAGTLGCS